MTEKMTEDFRCQRCGDRLTNSPCCGRATAYEAQIGALKERVAALEGALRWLHDEQDTSLHEGCTAANCRARRALAGGAS